ncbi:hypothetical protein PTTG_26994 [Puccinia triticina 1-1 BBBD Race 1]|uniref:Uncharacterized protein n=2 Tax=Puccinia triticina TaxID=208348 RepID=A0A180GPG5_PUCT1|nr:uncharacterized protein PtA15_13A164 [Puccinia triticina]OAV94338.1 hypothetical protein PTTG_26994 [Puccinia triticina 1-1 BBBD Race 1]WAQ90765.1 hypothetical protein PtA15_13A164 [Puccinia triticina]WAR60950.1 hypothetical protein PtB15_13B201 [Puccinia triticina]
MRLCSVFLVYLFSLTSVYSTIEPWRLFGQDMTRNAEESRAGPSGTANEIPRSPQNLIDLDPEVVDVELDSSDGSIQEIIDVDSVTSGGSSKRPHEVINLDDEPLEFNNGASSSQGPPLRLGSHQAGKKPVDDSPAKRRRLNQKALPEVRFDALQKSKNAASLQQLKKAGPCSYQPPGIRIRRAGLMKLAEIADGKRTTYNIFQESVDTGRFDFQSHFFKTMAHYKNAEGKEKELISDMWEDIDSDLSGQESYLHSEEQNGASSREARRLQYIIEHASEIEEKRKNTPLKLESLRQRLEGLIAAASRIDSSEAEEQLREDEMISAAEVYTAISVLGLRPELLRAGLYNFGDDALKKLNTHFINLELRKSHAENEEKNPTVRRYTDVIRAMQKSSI